MRVTRPAVCLALATALAAAGTASAAKRPTVKPKPVCNLITDTSQDGSGFVTNSDGMDIVSADIASDAHWITAVIRLAGPPVGAGDPNAPEGADYYFSFSAPDATNPVFLQGSTDTTGAWTYAMGDIEPTAGQKVYTAKAGTVKGTISGSVITLTVDRPTFSSLASVKPGTKLTSLEASVFYPVGTPNARGLPSAAALETADDDQGSKPYVAGHPSCVMPGS